MAIYYKDKIHTIFFSRVLQPGKEGDTTPALSFLSPKPEATNLVALSSPWCPGTLVLMWDLNFSGVNGRFVDAKGTLFLAPSAGVCHCSAPQNRSPHTLPLSGGQDKLKQVGGCWEVAEVTPERLRWAL